MEITGLPLHPLVVHLALASVALAGLSALAQALWAGARWLTRWTTPVLAAVAVVVVVVTRASGEALLADRFAGVRDPLAARLETHQDRADMLLWAVLGLAVVAVVAWFTLPTRSPLGSGRGARAGVPAGWAQGVVQTALVVTSVLAIVWLVLTGEAGARAVWLQP